jgi:hypothetical protein
LSFAATSNIYSILSNSVIGRGYPKKMGNNRQMTENKNYRELQITEELPPSPSGEGLGMRYLPKSVIGRGYPRKMGHNGCMTEEIPLNPCLAADRPEAGT